MRNTALLAAFALSTALVACGGAPDAADGAGGELGSQASAVQGGQLDSSTAHNFAVGIASKAGAVCSGTLIAPNLVLTARHCVVAPTGSEAVTCSDEFGPNEPASDLYVTIEANLYRARSYFKAAEVITPKATAFCGNDIALIILEDNIPASQAKPATPVVQFSMTDHTKIGESIAAVGFGVTSPSSNDSGQRRIREDIGITCIPGDKLYSKCDDKLAGVIDAKSEFVTQGWVCSGDSGSGAFDQKSFTDGAPYVLGPLSRGPQTTKTCLAAIYTRTDAHAEMIIEAGQKAAEKGGYEAPEWATPLSAAPGDVAAPGETTCDGDTCTDTSATDPAPTTVTRTTTTGCSATGARATGDGLLVFAGVGLALALGRRRRQSSARS